MGKKSKKNKSKRKVIDSPIVMAVDNVLDAVYEWYDSIEDPTTLEPEEVQLYVFFDKFLEISHEGCNHDHSEVETPMVPQSGDQIAADFEAYLKNRN